MTSIEEHSHSCSSRPLINDLFINNIIHVFVSLNFYFLINLFEDQLHENNRTFYLQMSLPGKKGRDASQLPTLSYEIKLNLPVNVDSDPQAISFLDLVANDSKFVRFNQLLASIRCLFIS